METPVTLSQTISCWRSTTGYVENKAGVWSLCLGNVPRVSDKGLLVEEGRTNYIRNNSMQGAVIGTPGTLPTNWNIYNPIGVSVAIVAVGVENGINYLDMRIFGTASGGGVFQPAFEALSNTAATAGQDWVASIFLKQVAGSLNNISQTSLILSAVNSSLNGLTSKEVVFALTPTLRRTQATHTTTHASTAFMIPFVRITTAAAGAVDLTFRMGWPQLERGKFATSPIRTINAAQTREADAISILNPVQVINQEEQTIFLEMTPHMAATAASAEPVQMGWVVKDYANSAYMSSDHNTSGDMSGGIGISVLNGGVVQINDWMIDVQPTTRFKCMMALADNNVRGAVNGSLGPLASLVTLPHGPPTRATIGSGPWQISNVASGYYHKVWFIPSRESDDFMAHFTRQQVASFNPFDAAPEIVLTNVMLTVARSAADAPSYRTVRSNISHGTGKRYFEMRHDFRMDEDTIAMGLATAAWPLSNVGPFGGWLGHTEESIGVFDVGYATQGAETVGDSPFVMGEWVGFAVDFDAGMFWFRNVSGWATGNPATGINPTISFPVNTVFFAAVAHYDTNYQVTANFGGKPFAYELPAGFGAWDGRKITS